MIADRATIEALIATIPALAGRWSIEPLAGLTNRSFRLSRDGEALVLRLPGAASGEVVNRGDEAHNTAIVAALGIAPALLYSDPSGLLVTRYLARARGFAASEASEPSILTAVGRLLARLHRSGARFRGAREPFANLDRYLALSGDAGDPDLLRLCRSAEPLRHALAAAAEPSVPSHIDPAPANFLQDGDKLLLIDWEYSAMAGPMWDLADYSTEADLDSDAMARLLEAHGGGASAPAQARLALWRIALDLLAAAWAQLRLRRSPSADLADMLACRQQRAAAAIGGSEYGRLLEKAAL